MYFTLLVCDLRENNSFEVSTFFMQFKVSIHTSPIFYIVTLTSLLKCPTVSEKHKQSCSRTDRQRSDCETERKDGRVEGKYFTSSWICVQIRGWARGNLCEIMLIHLYNMQGVATKPFFLSYRGGGELSHTKRRVTQMLRNTMKRCRLSW